MDANRYHRQAERRADLDERGDHVAPGGMDLAVRRQVRDERAVELQEVRRQLLESRKRCVAGPECIHADVHSELLDGRELTRRRTTSAHQHALGQLEPEPVGRDARLVERGGDDFGEPGFCELPCREVHRHPTRPTGVLPAPRLDASGAHRPRADGDDQAGLLGGLQELAGPQESARRMFPPEERLDAHDGASCELVDRLVVKDELAALERGHQTRFELESPRGLLDQHVVESMPPGPSASLGPVHRSVGVAQQRRRIGVLDGRAVDGRDPDARRDQTLPAVDHDGLLDGGVDA